MEFESSRERRLPIYLVLDTSESMVGEAIDSLNSGLHTILAEFKSDPMALETVWLSVISFASRAQQLVPLTDIVKFTPPALRVRPGTALGGALSLLMESIRREVRPNTPEQKGDWRPLVFLLTDGEPTDAWEAPARTFRAFRSGRPANLIAVGCGPDANTKVLVQITETVVLMRGDGLSDFKRFFAWISASTRRVSSNVAAGSRTGQASLAPLPPDLLEIAPRESLSQATPRRPRDVFLAARCSTSRRSYLIRYRLAEGTEYYVALQSHPVDEGYFSETQEDPSSNSWTSVSLRNATPCPYCSNAWWIFDMTSKTAFCSPPDSGTPGDVFSVRIG